MDKAELTAEDIADGFSAEYAVRLTEANINPQSGLATDYLNHYNEIAMLLEMLPDMPDMLEDCLEWKPCSYQDHFRNSGFKDKDLAIEAYDEAPEIIRSVFEGLTDKLDNKIIKTLRGLEIVAASDRGLSTAAQDLVRMRIEEVQSSLMDLNKVIHGKTDDILTIRSQTKEIGNTVSDATDEDAQTQADIDKLFD